MTNTQGFTPAPFPQLGPQDGIPPRNPSSEPPKKSKRRGPRQPKAIKAKPIKKQRKPKLKPASAPATPRLADAPIQRKARKPRALKVDLAVAMSALSGLSEDDAKVVHSFVQALVPFSKKARERILLALGKVIG